MAPGGARIRDQSWAVSACMIMRCPEKPTPRAKQDWRRHHVRCHTVGNILLGRGQRLIDRAHALVGGLPRDATKLLLWCLVAATSMSGDLDVLLWRRSSSSRRSVQDLVLWETFERAAKTFQRNRKNLKPTPLLLVSGRTGTSGVEKKSSKQSGRGAVGKLGLWQSFDYFLFVDILSHFDSSKPWNFTLNKKCHDGFERLKRHDGFGVPEKRWNHPFEAE